MADLIAQGTERPERWRRRLPELGQSVVLGRDSGPWSVPWDSCISRRHIELTMDTRGAQAVRIGDSKNPVYFQGHAVDRFRLLPGQHFVIGTTRFTLVDHEVHASLVEPVPDDYRTFSAAYLRGQQFRQAQQHLDALSRLPEMIRGAESDRELYPALMQLLLTGVMIAEAAAIVDLGEIQSASSRADIRILHWDHVGENNQSWQPSGPLIAEAVRSGESVLHRWQATDAAGRSEPGRTVSQDFDWAFCTPLRPEPSQRGRAIYLAGHLHRLPAGPESLESKLHDALKFVELVASTVENLQEVRRLQHRDAALAQFFSPTVREAIAGRSLDEVLAPRETEVTVLFCDLRGFSRQSEAQADQLMDLLQRVSESLGLVTRGILDFGGVIGDFHGDAVMGFWGWPVGDSLKIKNGCLAAIAIRASFERAARQSTHALRGFRVGMGLATGNAVAGKLGTVDQVKVTVFGPVVNLAARLESMSRFFETSILTDARTAADVADALDPSLMRVRPICLVQPYGMTQTHEIFELAPVAAADRSAWQDNASRYEAGRQAFAAGDWAAAYAHFSALPESDPLRAFFLTFLEQHHRQPPADWAGAIRLTSK